jgi:hypothetical protein
MAATIVQSAKGTSTSATVTASFPTTPTNGNLIVLCFAADDYNGTPNSGWTESTGMRQQTFHGSYLWWRVASGGSNSFQYTIGSGSPSSWVLMEVSGLDVSPYDVSNGQYATGSSKTYSTPALTPTAGDRLLVAAVNFNRNSGTLAGNTVTGWTNSFAAVDSIGSGPSGTNTTASLATRSVTANGSTSYSTSGTSTIDVTSASGLIIAFKVASGGGSQTLTGTLFTNTNTFYGGTVQRGAVTLSGTLFTNTNTFYAGTVAATYTVGGSLFTNTNSFYGGTVVPGAVTLTGSLFTDPDGFYGGTVAQSGGPQTLVGSLFTNSQTFYGGNVQTSITLDGSLFTDGDTFYGGTVTTAYVITGSLYTDPDTFFGGAVSQPDAPQTLVGELYANDNQFFGGVVAGGARNRGDDAPRRRPFVFEEQSQDEPEPVKRTVKRKVTLKRIEKAIELPDPGIPASWIPEPAQAKAFLPAQIAIPSFEAGDEQAIIAAIRDMIVQQAIEQDEEDIEMLLMVA